MGGAFFQKVKIFNSLPPTPIAVNLRGSKIQDASATLLSNLVKNTFPGVL